MTKIKIRWLLLNLAIIAVVIYPLFKPYILGTADGLAHKFRLVSFEKSISEGYLRPRWLADQALGYGSPLFLFNYLLPYYSIAIIHIIGFFSMNLSVQIYEALTLIMSYAGMYLLASRLWGRKAGLAAAAVYTLAPYHLLTIYLYEGWGELTAFVFPPWIMYLIIKIQSSKFKSLSQRLISLRLKNYNSKFKIFNFKFQFCILHFAFLIFLWSLFILSHHVSVFIFSPILLFVSFITAKNDLRSFMVVCAAFLISVLVTTFFWLPAISLNNLTAYPDLIGREMMIRGSYFKSLNTIFSVAVETIRKGSVGYYDFTVGLPIFIAILLFPISLFGQRNGKKERPARWRFSYFSNLRWLGGPSSYGEAVSPPSPFGKKNHRKSPRANFFHLLDNWVIWLFVLFFLSLYLSNYSSNWLWNIPFLHYVVYPFRFLYPATFAGSLIAGWVSGKSKYLAVFFILLAIVAGRPFTNPDIDRFNFPDSYFQNEQTVFQAPGTRKNMATTEFLPKAANLDFLKGEEEKYFVTKKLPERIEFMESSGKVIKGSIKAEQIKAEVQMDKAGQMIINTFYFPNWRAKIDDQEADIKTEISSGRMILEIPIGKHDVLLKFKKSRVEKIADMISIIIFFILITVLFLIWKTNLSKFFGSSKNYRKPV